MVELKRPRQESFDEGSAKRQRTSRSPSSLTCFSNEIILHILSFLDVESVCATQLLNKRISGLANDALLWKSLYRHDYPSRQAQRKLLDVESPLERMKRLGTIAKQDYDRTNISSSTGSITGVVDWKRRYRIRSNWSIGRCRTTTTSITNEPFHQQKSLDPVQYKSIHGRNFTISGNQVTLLNTDETTTTLSLPSAAAIKNVISAGTNQIFVATKSHIHLATISPFEITKSIPTLGDGENDTRQIVHHNDFIAVLTASGTLLIYDVSSRTAHHITTLRNSCVSGVDETVLDVRSMGPTCTVVSLVFPDHGILGTTMRVQEVLLSTPNRTVVSTRLALSPAHRRDSLLYNHPQQHGRETPVYTHPYLLVPTSNQIMIYLVSSTPDSLAIDSGRRLFGSSSAVESCRMNKPFRLVVGLSSDGQLRVWDILQLNRIALSPSLPTFPHGIIQEVNESKVVINHKFTGQHLVIHDFAI